MLGEGINLEVDALDRLESDGERSDQGQLGDRSSALSDVAMDIPSQASLLGQLLEILQDVSSNPLVVDVTLDLVQVRSVDLFTNHALNQTRSLNRVADTDQDDMGLETITVHQQSGEERVESIDTLDLFESDVFSAHDGKAVAADKSCGQEAVLQSAHSPLRELHDVLDSIDNLDPSGVVDRGDIARVEPTVLVDGLFGVLWVAVVSRDQDGTTDKESVRGTSSGWEWTDQRIRATHSPRGKGLSLTVYCKVTVGRFEYAANDKIGRLSHIELGNISELELDTGSRISGGAQVTHVPCDTSESQCFN